MRDIEPGNEIPLILPSRLKLVSSGQNGESTVPPLIELTLRMVYILGYNLRIQRNKIEKGQYLHTARSSLSNEIYDSLPPVLQQQISVGPVTICYFCKKPIFMYGVIWVIMKECYIENDLGPLCYILSTVVFCTVSCSSLYAHSESKSHIHNNLVSKKLNWFRKERTIRSIID